MNTSKTRTYYLRTAPRNGQKRGDPIACLMTSIDRDNKAIKYSISAAHPKDEFRKALGRTIAAGRLTSSPKFILGSVPTSGHDVSRLIMTDIVGRIEQVSRFKRDYIQRTYGNEWSYHLPARVGAAAQRWLDDAPLLKREARKPKPATKKDWEGYPQIYTLEQKEARVFTKKDLCVEGVQIPTIPYTLSNTRPDNEYIHNPAISPPLEMSSKDYAEWVKKDGEHIRIPAQEQLPVEPKVDLQKSLRENIEYFQTELPGLMRNKLLVGKFVIVSRRKFHSVYDTFQTAMKKAIELGFTPGEYIIQEITTRVHNVFNNGLASEATNHSHSR